MLYISSFLDAMRIVFTDYCGVWFSKISLIFRSSIPWIMFFSTVLVKNLLRFVTCLFGILALLFGYCLAITGSIMYIFCKSLSKCIQRCIL